jgi:hypothetical protein
MFLVTMRHPLDLAASLLVRHSDWNMALSRVVADLMAVDSVAKGPDILVVRYEDLIEQPEKH